LQACCLDLIDLVEGGVPERQGPVAMILVQSQRTGPGQLQYTDSAASSTVLTEQPVADGGRFGVARRCTPSGNPKIEDIENLDFHGRLLAIFLFTDVLSPTPTLRLL